MATPSEIVETQTVSLPAAERSAAYVDMLEYATSIWLDPVPAEEWLNSPHPLIQGQTPSSLLVSNEGRNKVEALLCALDNGFPV